MDEKLYEFLGAVFACEMIGKPYTHLEHDKETVTNAIETGHVKPVKFNDSNAIGFTTKGHLAYCGECSKRETAQGVSDAN